jgi:hypothetical protein
MQKRLKDVLDKWRRQLDTQQKSTDSKKQDTIIYPLLQYGAIDINYEHTLLTHLFTAQVIHICRTMSNFCRMIVYAFVWRQDILI